MTFDHNIIIVTGQDAEEVDPIEALGETIPGAPGEDYPIFATPPETSFICDGRIEVKQISTIEHLNI